MQKSAHPFMKFRTLQQTMITQVVPSLKMNVFTRPSAKQLGEFILGIEVRLRDGSLWHESFVFAV
jgi:hypothetical protein